MRKKAIQLAAAVFCLLAGVVMFWYFVVGFNPTTTVPTITLAEAEAQGFVVDVVEEVDIVGLRYSTQWYFTTESGIVFKMYAASNVKKGTTVAISTKPTLFGSTWNPVNQIEGVVK